MIIVRGGSCAEEGEEAVFDEKDFVARLHGGHETFFGEFVEVAGGGDTLGDAGFFYEAKLRVGAVEEQLDEFFGKGTAGEPFLALGEHGVEQGLNLPDADGGSMFMHQENLNIAGKVCSKREHWPLAGSDPLRFLLLIE